jgi:tetratricopeptide (TPR) repeat protein
MAEILEAIPVEVLDTTGLTEAAHRFEQAIKIGCREPRVAYLLALCYKKLGRTVEARQALRKIEAPDANILLQLGILSFTERNFAQAEQEFTQARHQDPAGYEAGYNLLLARLCLGKVPDCIALLPELVPLAPAEERRFLSLLGALLDSLAMPATASPVDGEKTPAHVNGEQAGGVTERDALLTGMTSAEERRLVDMLSGLGPFEAAYPLLRRLAALRPASSVAQEAYLEAVVVQGKNLMDKAQWEEAKELLSPLSRQAAMPASAKAPPRPVHIALLNMLGCCACMLQDFDLGVWYFNAALGKVGNDARLHQNLALAYEWQGRLDQADTHWNRYFDLLDRHTPAPPLPNYVEALAFEGLSRLADTCSKRERWHQSLGYLQRAHRLRPRDADVLERLFHLFNQMKRPDDARKILRLLREVRPGDPQFDLYELDIREVHTVEEVERMLSDVRKTLQRYPHDMRVEERAVVMAGNVIPLMKRLTDQLSGQANKVVEQMRRLPSYQIDWPAVREVMRELEDDFYKLRRACNKCLAMVQAEDHRRALRDLTTRIDRKIELCHSVGG